MILENNGPEAQTGFGGPGSGKKGQFKRLRVLPDEEYQRLKQKAVREYNPAMAALTELSEEGRAALSSALAGGPNTKRQLQQYHQSLEQAQSLRPSPALPTIRLPELKTNMRATEPISLAIPPAPPPPAPPPPTGPAPGPEAPVEEIEGLALIASRLQRAAKNTPTAYRRMAGIAVQAIADKPDILAVSENNEAVIDGQPISGSNFYDLFRALYYKPTSANPEPDHLPKFFDAIRRINVPRHALAAHARTQVGMGRGYFIASKLASPPGIRIRKHAPRRRTIRLTKSKSPKSPKVLRVYNNI